MMPYTIRNRLTVRFVSEVPIIFELADSGLVKLLNTNLQIPSYPGGSLTWKWPSHVHTILAQSNRIGDK